MISIDLNADLGEGTTEAEHGRDEALMDHISSCNIACGGHAGDGQSMARMLMAAKAKGLAAGAHPSFPDKEGFGRKAMNIKADTLFASLYEQIAQLQGLAQKLDMQLSHIKPHGALYNILADNTKLAEQCVAMVAGSFPDMALVGLAGGAMQKAAQHAGHPFLAEAFIDRGYRPNGQLVPRTAPGAMVEDDAQRVERAIALAYNNPINSADGNTLTIKADTLCIHSDTDGALQTVQAVRSAFLNKGIAVKFRRPAVI